MSSKLSILDQQYSMVYIILIFIMQQFLCILQKTIVNLLGLGLRKFRVRVVEVGDQLVWIDILADKVRKVLYLNICEV